MNKLQKVLLYITLCYLWAYSLLGPSQNEYAHNPITPGYDISDYFVLNPITSNHKDNPSSKNITSGANTNIVLKKDNRFQYVLQIYNLEIGETLNLKIVGVNGRIFSSRIKKIRGKSIKFKIEFDGTYSSGMYIIYVSTSSYQESIKFPLFQ